MDQDLAIRTAAFQWLNEKTDLLGEVLPRPLLAAGFTYQGQRVPLVSPQGIFKPRQMELPLSITTSPAGPYDDGFAPDGLLLYKYRGTDPWHRDNVGLRRVFRERRPLVYFHGVVPGQYMAVWPVFVVADEPTTFTFKVAVEDMANISEALTAPPRVAEQAEGRRAYLTATVKRRLHQYGFRERVLRAYRQQCAVCRLKHRELLDAAHIIPDALPDGQPTVPNGLALCKLHHAAFDKFILGITPDYRIHIRSDILEEIDGPMLQHGLIELHRTMLTVPPSRANLPDRDALAWRYEQFVAAT